MSRHRFVKTLDVEAELDDFDGDDYDSEEELQMQRATSEVRSILGDNFPDKDIQESLWYYYFDVEKTVDYLLNKKTKKDTQKPKATTIKIKEPSTATSAASQPTVWTNHEGYIRDFFADTPWFGVPAHRLAQIKIEPRNKWRGLLGGSSQGPPKVSKLAALAAARKKKEAERNDSSSGGGSVALLDRLSKKNDGNASPSARPEAPSLRSPLPRTLHSGPKAPRSQNENKKPLSSSWKLPSEETEVTKPVLLVEEDVLLSAKPSQFALTIIGSATLDDTDVTNLTRFKPWERSGMNFAENPFAGPSPDDIVSKAQSASKGLKSASRQTQQQPTPDANRIDSTAKSLSEVKISETPPVAHKRIDVIAALGKMEQKKAVNFVVIGHVDAGKSTLMGRLLQDLKVIDQRTIERYRREAEKIGKSSFALAWVLDQGSDEREHGVTIDVAVNKFETPNTIFTILDAPGHKDFVPNMIAGASQADLALLVIDASTGSFESGLKGQTKEHALLVRSMGLQRLIVAVNKLDAVDWSQDRFNEISQQLSAFLSAAGYPSGSLSFVPCSGLKGENVTTRSSVCDWYQGPTVLELLESSEVTSQTRDLQSPFRLSISEVFSGASQYPLSAAGRISSGTVQIGDKVVIVPHDQSSYVKAIEVDGERRDWAAAGQNAVIHLSEIDQASVKVKGGDIICSFDSPVQCQMAFAVKILAFEHILPTFVNILIGRMDVPGRVSKLISLIDKSTGKPPAGSKKKPRVIKPGSAARIEVVTLSEGGIPVEAGARVVLRAEGETIATGVVEPF